MAKRRRRGERAEPCPCGRGATFDECCGPILAGRPASTAEDLMRSRYSAYVLGDAEHLHRSWHPDHRPASIALDPAVEWLGLEILATEEGRELDRSGTVEFEARYSGGALRERSRFTRLDGAWVYMDGTTAS